ncbi:MAG TPA: GDP-mannose 4,6-dehydratase, partial [Bacteroidales bacterium]|nr:GDP-mannose 4,6-dehydratase [Bacteroidales bacterium]
MKYKRLMITGGYGFIGSNFINYLFKKYKNEISVLNIDSLTYASNQKYINSEYYNSSRYKHFTRNINDITWYDINKFKPDCIIHFAAESH